MHDATFHIRIKKEYAAALIEDLIKVHAVENIEEELPNIPEWQKVAVRKTLQQVQQNPTSLQPWEVIKQKYKQS